MFSSHQCLPAHGSDIACCRIWMFRWGSFRISPRKCRSRRAFRGGKLFHLDTFIKGAWILDADMASSRFLDWRRVYVCFMHIYLVPVTGRVT